MSQHVDKANVTLGGDIDAGRSLALIHHESDPVDTPLPSAGNPSNACSMAYDDPRHGTSAGYIAGCRGTCCRRAKSRYDKRRRWELLETGQYRKTPSFRAVRRIRALQALGWSVPEVARVSGISYRHLYNLDRHATCYISTFAAVDRAYRAMAMTLPPESNRSERISAVRARNHAARNGWPPPLAWTDIDDPDENPTDWHYRPADRADHLADLDARQAGISEVCAELGIRRDSVERWCERHGLRPMYVRFMERETPVVERRNQWSA